MISMRFLLFLGTCAVLSHSHHTLGHVSTPKSTLDLFTQMEPEITPWWFQRIGEEKPIIPSLNIFASTMITDDCITVEQCILKKLYGGPMFIVTKDPEKLGELIAYYTEKGLNTIFKDGIFKSVHEFLSTPEPKSAVLFNSRKVYNFKMANTPISRIVTPQDFKLTDLDILSRIGERVPVLFITDKDDFDTYKFAYINHFKKFNIFEEGVEPEIK